MREVLCWVHGFEPYHMKETRTEIRTGAWRGEVYALQYEEDLVRRLIRLIDGRRIRSEILAALPPESRSSGEVVLDHLRAAGLIHTKSVPDNWPGPDAVHRFLLAFPVAGQIMEAIAGARVLLIGLGVFGSRIAAGLAQLGTGMVTLIDGQRITSEDRMMNMAYSMAREGVGRAAHLRRFLSRYSSLTGYQTTRFPSSRQRLRALVSQHDLVITAFDRPMGAISAAVNQACLETGVAWAQVVSDSLLVIVGPLFLPGETGCFHCWESELTAHMTKAQRRDYERFEAERLHTGHGGYVGTPGTADLAAGLLLSDIPFILSGSDSRLPGRYIAIDLPTQSMDLYEVHSRSRCPSCSLSRGEPRTNAASRRA